MSKCTNCGARFVQVPESIPPIDQLCHACGIAALRAENERLARREVELTECAYYQHARIAQLEAGLEEVAAEHVVPIEEMSVECLQQTLTWKMARASGALN